MLYSKGTRGGEQRVPAKRTARFNAKLPVASEYAAKRNGDHIQKLICAVPSPLQAAPDVKGAAERCQWLRAT